LVASCGVPYGSSEATNQLAVNTDVPVSTKSRQSQTAFSIPLASANQSESWVRLTVRLDFAKHTWDIYANGNIVAADIPFISNASTYFSTFLAQGAGSSESFFDDIYVGASNPLFADSNDDGTNPSSNNPATPSDSKSAPSTGNGISTRIAFQGSAKPLNVNASIPTSGLKLWLEANVGVTSNSNGNVSTWQDQSGNGNNATQTNSSNQPLVVANALNGLSVIQFTASTNQWFNLPNVMNGATAGEVFVVVKANSGSPSAARGLWRLGANSYYPYTDGNVYEDFGSTVQYNEIGHPASGVTQFSLFNVSAQSGQWTGRIDGVTLLNSTTNTVSFNSSPLLGSNGSNPFDGQIAEVIVYNSVLNAAQRTTVGQYLQGKYNLPGIAVPANPTNLIVNPLSATETSLVWSDTPTNTGITYTVWRETGSGGYAAVAQVNNSLSYVDSGLTAGTNYSYEISSSTFAGSSPGYSNAVSVTTLASGTDMPLTGIKLWLIADSGVQATSSGNTSIWQDASGGGNNATQLTVANEPIWVANALNGRPVMQFTASSSQSLSLPNLMSGATAGEVFVVVKATSASPSTARGLWRLGANSYYPYTDGNVYDYFGSSVQNEVGHPASGVAQYSLYNVSAQAGQWTARIDGVTLLNSTTNTVSFNTTPLLGSDGSYPFDGEIAEVIVYNSVLTAAQRATVGQYLQGKYAMPGIAVPANPTNLQVTPLSATDVLTTRS
jgi:hypothetical protein